MKKLAIFGILGILREKNTIYSLRDLGGGVNLYPSGVAVPRACGRIFFFAIQKVAKNNDFTWVLDETCKSG